MIQYLSRYSVIARVTLSLDSPAFVSKVNGHICYPVGRFETVLTTNELTYALQQGWLESVSEFSWYRKASLFESYIDRFYSLRMGYKLDGNTGFETICKLLINSLYGKFGQTGIRQTIIGSSAYDEIWHMPVINEQTGVVGYRTSLGGVVYEDQPGGESYHAIPAIAAHVTANARLYLYSLMMKSGRENVFYVDTDSLIVNREGYERLAGDVVSNELGKLKIEQASSWIVINAPKDYEMEGRRKIKGIRENAVELSPGVFEQEQWIKLAGLIRQGFQRGYTSKTIVKHQQRLIYSGVVGDDGGIDPFEL
jgi:hypothetical protein